MNTQQDYSVSLFAQMIDKLRGKSEEELKMLYLKLFADELIDEWKAMMDKTDFSKATDEEIIQAIIKNRYSN